MNTPIRIILADDHAIVRAGFRMLLSTDESIAILAEADRGEQACQLYFELLPDVLVLDLSMPGIGGLESIRRIIHRDPVAKILVFSVHNEAVYVSRALQAGAMGYINKNAHPDILLAAIKSLARGEKYIEDGLLKTLPGDTPEADYRSIIAAFSSREFDIFLLLAQGYTIHKIAEEVCLGHKTVANYGTQIRTKLKATTVAELAHIAIGLGLMPGGSLER